MKKSKLIAAVAAGMLLSTGAMAAESNLGAATVGASQTGMFGGGMAGISAPVALAVTAVVFAVVSEEVTDYTAPVSPIQPIQQPPLHGMSPAHVPPGN